MTHNKTWWTRGSRSRLRSPHGLTANAGAPRSLPPGVKPGEAVPYQLGVIGPDVSGISSSRSLGQLRQGHLLPSALEDQIPEGACPVRLLPDLWYVPQRINARTQVRATLP